MRKPNKHMLFMTLDDIVAADHPCRKLDALLSFDELAKPYVDLYSVKGRKEKGVALAYESSFYNSWKSMSDREMECFLRENNSGKWFCELGERKPRITVTLVIFENT